MISAWLNHVMSVSAVLMWQSSRAPRQDAGGGSGGSADVCGPVLVRATPPSATAAKGGGAHRTCPSSSSHTGSRTKLRGETG